MSRYKWAVVALVGVLCLASLGMRLFSMVNNIPTIAQMNNLPVIIIDPGHGGLDGGAVGVDNIIEKDINLNLSLTLRDIFLVSGFEVVMTRDTDVSIYDDGVTGTRNQKVSDLHNRLALIEQYPNAIVISIHQNKFGQSSSKGTQVFYSPNHAGSERLAEILQAGFIRNLQPQNNRQKKQAGKNLYLMTESRCPAVLVECGFLSNSDEAHRLLDPEYQAQVAFTVFSSVMEYLELDRPAAPVTLGT